MGVGVVVTPVDAVVGVAVRTLGAVPADGVLTIAIAVAVAVGVAGDLVVGHVAGVGGLVAGVVGRGVVVVVVRGPDVVAVVAAIRGLDVSTGGAVIEIVRAGLVSDASDKQDGDQQGDGGTGHG